MNNIAALFLTMAFVAVLAVPTPDPIVLGVPWTAFDAQGNINLDVIPAFAAFAKKNNVNTIWVNGGMSQFDSLSTEERKAIAEAYVREAHKLGLYVIIHVGDTVIERVNEMALHAQSIGADAVAALPPYKTRSSDINVLYQWFALALRGCNLPFYYYHFPSSSGVNINVTQFVQGATVHMPTLRGVKFVADDLWDFLSASRVQNGKFLLLWAQEPKIRALPFGAKHIVLAEMYYGLAWKHIYQSWLSKDMNMVLAHEERVKAYGACMRSGVGRYVMKEFGIDLGMPRLPEVGPNMDSYTDSVACLRSVGFFNQTMIAQE